MNELSLHILDLVQNSISAGATLVLILIHEQPEEDLLVIEIIDDGCGMSAELLARVTSPFATTRKTRKVGLGIPMFKQCAEMCGGRFELTSTPGKGTHLTASFQRSHVDLPPLGDLAGTMLSLVIASPEKPEFVLRYTLGKECFEFDTRQIREALGGLALSSPDIVSWMRAYLEEGLDSLKA